MTTIVGQYECKADVKGRITVPTSLKNKLVPYMGDEFIIKYSVYEDCLELYPKEVFDNVMAKMMSHKKKGKQFQAFMRRFNSGLQYVPIDAENGRLQIPRNLFVGAGLSKEVVLNASHDKIEVWDKVKYDEALGAMSDADYEAFAEEIFNDDE